MRLQPPGVLWIISGMSHPKDLTFPPANRDPPSCPELGSPSRRGALDGVSAGRDLEGGDTMVPGWNGDSLPDSELIWPRVGVGVGIGGVRGMA